MFKANAVKGYGKDEILQMRTSIDFIKFIFCIVVNYLVLPALSINEI